MPLCFSFRRSLGWGKYEVNVGDRGHVTCNVNLIICKLVTHRICFTGNNIK